MFFPLTKLMDKVKDKIKLVGQYVGSKRITNIGEAKRKTFLGKDVFKVIFNDDIEREYPVEILEAIVTKKGSNLTDLRNRTEKYVGDRIMGILTESELPVSSMVEASIMHLLQSTLVEHVLDKTKEGTGKMFKKDYEQINLYDINQALKNERGKKKNKKDANRK